MAPTALAVMAKPVVAWQGDSIHGGRPHSQGKRQNKSCKTLTKATIMSDADTEGSSGAWRNVSITSSERDGPHIAVHSTSEDKDNDGTSATSIHSLLMVSGQHSLTTTDIGSDYTSEGGESNHEVGPQPLTPQLVAALVKQLEDYFSDDGLAKDLFLLKHVKRHRDGFVSLKLLSGYKNVKKISRDWRTLAAALRSSTTLQVNDEGTKVKRRAPLPPTLLYDAPSSRAIVAVNVPAHQATMAGLAVLFGTYGTVASLHVVRPKPGGGVPPELQTLVSRVPKIATTTCAVVEYEDVWGAARALQELINPPMTLHVLRRSRRPSPNSSRNSLTPTPTPKGRMRGENGVSAEELRQRLKCSRSKLRHIHNESSTSEGEDSGSSQSWWRQGSPHLTPQPPLRPTCHALNGCSMSTPSSPASYRRTQHHLPVTRHPRGPDGTRGFSRVRTLAGLGLLFHPSFHQSQF
ncbi:la-related protein 6-like [Homarus americanus]|uniref:La-related protein 6-like 2 n=1 Tax=Homarus americanus TaxID=6706 RepID=A0A8J5KEU4_HOMAM|nr:la-related protein 6-like [Homarus americanus]KAG7170894.1 La-related protein 6-like 2 [Homarus americanus]